ncbi:nuclear transport factor 2 family protein [Actinomadura scrupuli]|uniref:nuclear transport factor 2 family protein n=1 Tax=Actinomadura scrupuli TaxID=559629 RepID=UPI003D991175
MDLIAIEEIRTLKYRYLRTLDLKQWDEFTDTLTADATAEYGTATQGRPLTFTNRDQIVSYMRDALGPAITTVHSCTHPEIAIDGETATGSWCLEDTVLVPEYKLLIKGAAYYSDRYRREDGGWRICHTGYVRTYEATIPLGDLPGFKLTANLWGG